MLILGKGTSDYISVMFQEGPLIFQKSRNLLCYVTLYDNCLNPGESLLLDNYCLRIFQNDNTRIHWAQIAKEWMEINLVTLQRLNKTIPQQMHGVIKAKGSPVKYKSV